MTTPRTDDQSTRVGIVILNYNGARDTLACLESLEELRYPAAVIVIDNGSTDDSVAQLRASTHDFELTPLPRNLGFAEGNNVGVRVLVDRGVDYVWLLNNDTKVEPDSLGELVRAAEADTKLAAVGSVIYEMHEPTRVQTWGGGRVSLRTGLTRAAAKPGDPIDYITGCSTLLRVAALRELGLLDARYFFLWEDTDWCLRARAAGWRIAVAPASRIWHVGGGTESNASPLRMEYHAAGLVLFLRQHSPVPRLAALPMFGYYAWLTARHANPSILGRALAGWRRGWRL